MPRYIPGEGPLTAQIALIGEAPGADEDREGRPFVGAAGKELDRWLLTVGIERDGIYITNLVKERPPNNKLAEVVSFTPPKRLKTDKDREKQTHYENYLRWRDLLARELQVVDAYVLVPLGAPALFALTGAKDIGKRRGALHLCTLEGLEGVKVLPTYHPAAGLHKGNVVRHGLPIPLSLFGKLDLQKAKKQSAFRDVRLPNRDFKLTPTYEEILQYIGECRDLPRVGFDIETTTFKRGGKKYTKEMFCFSLAKSSVDALVCCFSEPGGVERFTCERETHIMWELKRLLEDSNVTKVGQNLNYDNTVLFMRYGIIVWPIEDTMVAHCIHMPDAPKSLAFLASIYTDEPYYKDTGGKFFDGKAIEWESFLRYSALDSALCLEILPQVLSDLERLGNTKEYRTYIEVHKAALVISARGFRMDGEGLARSKAEAKAELKATYEALETIVGRKLPSTFVRSPLQIKEYLREKGIHIPTRNKKESTDEKALTYLAGNGLIEAQLILDARRRANDLSKYWSARLDPDGRFRGWMHPVGTDQARFSSTQTPFGTGSNFQNQPVRMKRNMLADDGCIPVWLDLAQAENRIVAYLSMDKHLIYALERGEDMHRVVAGLIFNKAPEDVSSEKGSTKIGGGKYSERDLGKKTVHGVGYGMGPDTLAENLEISRSDGRWLHARIHMHMPNIKSVFWSYVEEQLRSKRRLVNCFGRVREFISPWCHELLKVGYSYLPQSTVADILVHWGLVPLFDGSLGSAVEPIDLMNQVHDSIVFQMDARRWTTHEMALAVSRLEGSLLRPISYGGRTFTIPVDVTVGRMNGNFVEGESTLNPNAFDLVKMLSHAAR